jgi:integrase
VTLKKLRFLLTRAVQAFGDYRLDELDPVEIAAWGMTVPPGYRFEATQALRQVLARAVVWRMIAVNPAKQGVDNPQRRRTEKRPFESWEQLDALAARLEARLGAMVVFAAATGMRPGEWVALEQRDIDRAGRVAYVNRSFSKGRLTYPKTEASRRAVPLQARALAALDQLPPSRADELLFPAERGGYLDLHNFRNRDWKPAQLAVGIEPFRRIYDLRHAFATFALRAGISTFELSRYMGASLTMIDRHYGHLARDGREHAIRLLDELNAPDPLLTIATRGNGSQPFWLISAVLATALLAADCHRLQPRGSIKAPYSVVRVGYVAARLLNDAPARERQKSVSPPMLLGSLTQAESSGCRG